MAPSAVPIDRIETDDLFVLRKDGTVAQSPANAAKAGPEKKLALSHCSPLFMIAYKNRNAGAVLQSHSKHVVLASMIYGIRNPKEGRSFRNDEEIVVPIIENACFEAD